MIIRFIKYLLGHNDESYIWTKEKLKKNKNTKMMSAIKNFGFKTDIAMMRIGLGNTSNGMGFSANLYYKTRESILNNPDKYPEDVVEIAKNMRIKDIDKAVLKEKLSNYDDDCDSRTRRGRTGRRGRSERSARSGRECRQIQRDQML